MLAAVHCGTSTPVRSLGGGTGRGGGVDGAVAQPREYEQVWGCHLIPGVRKGVCLCSDNKGEVVAGGMHFHARPYGVRACVRGERGSNRI